MIATDILQRDRDQQIVDVVTAKVRVPVRRDDLEDAFMQLEDRHIERPAAIIVHRDQSVFFRALEPVRQRRRRRFIHQPDDLQPGDPPRILRRLAAARH